MPGVPCARAEAVMRSSLRLSGRRKGACGSSLWKQSGDSAGSWAGPPRAATPCVGLGVTGAKGTLARAVTGGWPCPAMCWVVEGGLSGIRVFRLPLRNIYGRITSRRQCPQEVNSPAAGG